MREQGKWTCEVCLWIRPAGDSIQTYEEGCRFVVGSVRVARRRKKELGEKAKVGPCSGPATPAVGVVDVGPLADGNLELDADVGVAPRGSVPSGVANRAVTKEEVGGDPPPLKISIYRYHRLSGGR